MKKLRIIQQIVLCLVLLLIPFSSSYSAPTSALQKVIEGSKKEGKLSFFGAGQVYDTAKLEKGIKDKFGVDLKITVLPGRQTQAISKVAMEIQSGIAPSYDVMTIAHTNVMSVLRPQGLVADIDWRSLIAEVGTINSENYIPAPADYVADSGYVQTLVYNSAKLSALELPQRFMDITDPKWKGRFGWKSYPIANAELCYFLGLRGDDGVEFVRKIMNNKPATGSFDALNAKMSMGELDFAVIGSQEYNKIPLKDPNTTLKWFQLKDFCLVTEIPKIVIKGAKNINAAQLFVLWCATPEGIAYQATFGASNHLDPKSPDYAMIAEAKKAGIPIKYGSRTNDYSEWLSSKECADMLKKIDLVIKGAQGGRGR